MGGVDMANQKTSSFLSLSEKNIRIRQFLQSVFLKMHILSLDCNHRLYRNYPLILKRIDHGYFMNTLLPYFAIMRPEPEPGRDLNTGCGLFPDQVFLKNGVFRV